MKNVLMRPGVEAAIKGEIEKVFGRKIVSSRDCIHLSDEIFNRTKNKLNHNTLRRFFGLVKSRYLPSRATISILCNYCGFRSADEVQDFTLHQENNTGCIQADSLLSYFVTLFNELPVEDDPNKIFYNLVKQTIQFLNRHREIVEKFQRLIVKTKHGKKYYFERFINIDCLDTFYGDGLRYYLLENEAPEAKVFAHALLVFRYWLTRDDQKLESNFAAVITYSAAEPASAAAQAFYFAASLFHAHIMQLPPAPVIAAIQQYHAVLKSSVPASFPFEAVVAEALILTGSYEEGLFYLNHQLQKAAVEKPAAHMVQRMYLFRAAAMYKINDQVNAARTLRKIRPSQFHFLAIKYQTILFGILTGKMKSKVPAYTEQVSAMIQQTGFIRMETLL